MGFFDLFRRAPPIANIDGLRTFIDEEGAFLAQKGVYEYSRARAGHYAKVLFKEQAFQDVADRARWQAYPLGLAMVGEMVEGVLRPHANDRAALREALVGLVLSVFDRYPVPAPLGADAWSVARADLTRRLQAVSLHPPKPVKDIPEPFAQAYFALMPIHEKLRGRDYPTMHNYLRVTLINIHDRLVRRADVPALVAALSGIAGQARGDAPEP
jgi:hypothetical protein